MLLIRNNAVLTTAKTFTATAEKIPFDTIVYNTNGNLAMDDNNVVVSAAGMYDTQCSITVSNTSSSAAAAVTLQAYADGEAIKGAKADVTIAASSTASITLPWSTNVIAAASGKAKLSWYLSGAVNLVNASARVEMVV